MRLTLDWDSDRDLDHYVEQVTSRPDLTRTGDPPHEIRQSSGGVGYHYVEPQAAGDWETIMRLRDEYGDDSKRLKLDRRRHNLGSPFLQVLYQNKYMSRWGWQPETGNEAEVTKPLRHSVPEQERIKNEAGRLMYDRIAEILSERVYGSGAGLAESIGVSGSTARRWIRGDSEPSESNRKKLRRRARSHGIGHYLDEQDKAAERAGLAVEYVDSDEHRRRRTVVEYADAPWDWNIGDADREYGLINVHTGTFNDNHSEEQLKHIHDDIMDRVLELLSPSSPRSGQQLSLDRETRHPVDREESSVNYEDEILDLDEARYYRAGTISRTGSAGDDVSIRDLEKHPIFEVIVWTDRQSSMEWHLIGVWDGETPEQATILTDSEGWW